jgi:xanthine/CO dehydrogenase XdhC/CoxF family maturation factor
MSYRKQVEFLERHRAAGVPLVMATVFETQGSTYSKAGARMLIDGDGRFQGMLSGGCLEGDLAMRARVVLESGQTQFATYDLASEADELWGMGVGCAGVMRVILQALDPANDYAPAGELLELLAGRDNLTVITCLESSDARVPVGTTVVRAGPTRPGGPAPGLLDNAVGAAYAARDLEPGETRILSCNTAQGTLRALLIAEAPVPRLLVLGAGADAEPLVRFAAELGWLCTISDHRPAYIDGNEFSVAHARHCIPVDSVSDELALDKYDLAIVMSHHLASDRSYLRQLASTGIAYVGLLGPPDRRTRLVSELGDSAAQLADRLHGPAGLDLGGRGPAAIALSIVAQMQQHLAATRGQGKKNPERGG